jgi:N utilization substance protein A
VREPGDRAKIAVASNEKDVDPVGACVGMKGSRVQSIIKELRGEKIDIIEWSDEPSVFAANALSPAKVSQVRITDINKRKMEVIVAEDQLSLAIGKKGQNVRLATRLVGWDIDIVSEEKLKKEIALQMGKMMASGEAVPLSALEGVTPNQAEILAEKGIEDVEALAAMNVDDLVEYLDVSLDEAEQILSSAKAIVEARNQEIEPGEEGEPSVESTDASEESSSVAEAIDGEASSEEEGQSSDSAAETIADEKSGEQADATTEGDAEESQADDSEAEAIEVESESAESEKADTSVSDAEATPAEVSDEAAEETDEKKEG